METSNPCTAQSPRPCGTRHRREVTPGGVVSVQQISSPKSMNCFLSVSRLRLSLECRWCCARSDLHGFLHVDNRSHKHAHETTGGLGPGLSAWRDASLNKAALKSTSEGASIDHGFYRQCCFTVCACLKFVYDHTCYVEHNFLVYIIPCKNRPAMRPAMGPVLCL